MFKNSLLIPDCKSVKSRTLLFIILHCRYVQSTFEATPFSGHFTDAKYIFISDAILFMTSSRFMMSPKRASFSDNNEGVTSDFRRNKQLKLQCCTLFTHKKHWQHCYEYKYASFLQNFIQYISSYRIRQKYESQLSYCIKVIKFSVAHF